MRTLPQAGFPWDDVISDAALGLAASFVAACCMTMLASYLGPQDCIVIFNDHVVGGTEDRITMVVLGTIFGAISVFCACRIRDRFADWRRAHGVSYLRVVPR